METGGRLQGAGQCLFAVLGSDLDSIGGDEFGILTLTLRGLERDGLVTRTVFPTIPPRVDYELTDLGRGLWKPVEALGKWAADHQPEIESARAKFDGRNAL